MPLVWLSLGNSESESPSNALSYGVVQAVLVGEDIVAQMEGELPERNLAWLTYQGLVAPSEKG